MRKCANLCVAETRFLERDIFRRHFVSTADERAMDVVVDNVAVRPVLIVVALGHEKVEQR